MNLSDITPVVLTLNEEANLERCLEPLAWAREVIVVDSGSRDRTASLAAERPNVRLVERAFDSAAGQWNFAIREAGIRTEWVLALDADYVLSPAFVRELAALPVTPEVEGYRARFRYCVFGTPLRGSLYPPVTVLFRRERASYEQDGHTQRLRLAGEVRSLAVPIHHDDRKPLATWLANQARYARLEAEKLEARDAGSLGWPDRLRKGVILAPFAAFTYSLFWKGTCLDGWPGLFYALQRFVAEAVLSLELLQRRWQRRS